ncbi:SDR family NAD(P)-dependent oxidoreductase [Amaricoccus sp.]|uniref:SDR family NAD(P)-dependent oxidoreductase n=1 Tax=Amaricoccus sp. TaxID=1872485 RepID=UPI001B4F9033|nr:SDR family NAD(P)-dependent oxidoreductase [Amaricoccus sp.]MBP7000149.1 SDR family NAD(P)-dependent oxidoreductase [Amaricoccus sp.]
MRLGAGVAAVVTGGGSGLGAATARMLAGRGARVGVLDLDAAAAARVAAEIGGVAAPADVADAASVAAALATAAAAHGPARILVACAGIVPGARTVGRDGKAHDPAVFGKVIAVNLLGTFNAATQAAAAMAALEPVTADGERGVIVTTSSVAAWEGQVGQIGYAASKGAVAAMALPMARDLAAFGVRVVSIAPGLFMTPMLEGLPEETKASLGRQVPFPARLGDPTEYAALVATIVENPMLNGSVIRLDGAIRMGPR